MRRAIFPALLAIALVAFSSADAQAFGLFHHFGGNDCDACCDTVAEPACGCEEPVCGCEVVEPCCDQPKHGLLHRLFHHKDACCDSGCGEIVEPACGCEAPIAQPACGLEAPACGCDAPCHKPHHAIGGFFKKLFHHHDDCCDSACGEIIEPACGFESAPSYGEARTYGEVQ